MVVEKSSHAVEKGIKIHSPLLRWHKETQN